MAGERAVDMLSELQTALDAHAVADRGRFLDEETIRPTLEAGLGGRFTNGRVLILIPDHTRTIPLPQLFRLVVEILADVRQLDFMVALGTHPPLSEEAICRLVGITSEARRDQYDHIRIFNHAWERPDALAQIGTLSGDQIKELAGDAWHPSLGSDVPVVVNRLALEYDQLIILGPTFPHEVVGFSGGAKYLFPGISGPQLIHVTHWLGALVTIMDTIGIEATPMRDIIHAAAELVSTPVKLVALTVVDEGLAGMFIGDHISAFHAAAELSSERHIIQVDRPFRRVLSHAPPMYDELWVAAKAMYKVEPAVADGGEIIVYAPHLDEVSRTHGQYIYQVGYHVRDYFLRQWDQFNNIPLGVLAHSTHLRGSGVFENGVEKARIRVTLSSRLRKEDCASLSLGYLNPNEVDVDTWRNREDENILYIPKAGETLYRLQQ